MNRPIELFHPSAAGGVPEPTKTTDTTVGRLRASAKQAIRCQSFIARNTLFSVEAGKMNYGFALKSLFPGQELPSLQEVFVAAAKEAGQLFRKVFNDSGNKMEGPLVGKGYKDSVNDAGPIALKYLSAALRAAEIEGIDNPEALVANATFTDALAIAAKMLDVEMPHALTKESVVEMLNRVCPQDDYFYGEIDHLTLGPKRENPLEQDMLELGVRLAHNTWLATQVHRAAYEGNEDRINSSEFAPLDLYVKGVYEEHKPNGPEAQLSMVGLAVWKDILSLRQPLSSQSATLS